MDVNTLLKEYQVKRDRKVRLIQPYIELKNSIDGFNGDTLKEIQFHVLDTEINMLDKIINDLYDLL